MQTDTPAARAQRRRARLGKPRLLIVGCGKVGLEIVARLHRRFRIFATTTSSEHFPQLRRAGAVPVAFDLDGRRERPIAGASRRRSRAHKAWNVDTHMPPQSEPSSDSTRARISSAARLNGRRLR